MSDEVLSLPAITYFDYMATTPVDPRVKAKMLHYLSVDDLFANPASSSHRLGHLARQAVDQARQQVADCIHALPQEIIWTSGATEAINLALKGVAQFHQRRGRHIVTSAIEHKATLDTCRFLEQQGYSVTYLQPDANGQIAPDDLQAALRDDTILVSIMLVNNEVGVIQDMAALTALTRPRGILMHTDAVQAIAKLAVDVDQLGVDLMSVSAHKAYGPKGIGALYVRSRPRVRLTPQMHGGGQQGGLRSGTLATHQIVGMGEAFALAQQEWQADQQRIGLLATQLWQGLQQQLPALKLNGHPQQRVANNLNICFSGVAADALMMGLSDMAFAAGSACNSMVTEASYVLKALGLSDMDAFSSVRISLGRFTTSQEITDCLAKIVAEVQRLRALSPLWAIE